MVIEASGEGERAAEDGVAPAPHVVVVVDVGDGCAAAELEGGCRICHLGDGDGELPERVSGRLVRLGCGCRGELAAAHRRCAEAWFSVRGNKCVARFAARMRQTSPAAAARNSYGNGTTRRVWTVEVRAASAGASRFAIF
ncbi:hypothetical protein ACP70R_034716 [Stipagrostis hirtigluma subsp. patula]